MLPFVLGFRVQDFVFQAGLPKKFSLSLSLALSLFDFSLGNSLGSNKGFNL